MASLYSQTPETHLLAEHLHLEATEHLFLWSQQQHSWNSFAVCVMITNSPELDVTPRKLPANISVEFRAIKSVASVPFDASHVGHGLAELEGLLWCDACYTRACMCVRECLLRIQRPFSK